MAEAGEDEAPDRSINPFDAQTSGRNPFPSFEAALGDEQPTQEQDSGSALDWSIDTLAELKPAVFSPLPQQRDASSSGTPLGTSRFFEDEKQYEVLRTPLPTAGLGSGVRLSLTPSPSPSPPLELHRRCRETIARCEARLRERQRKMDKLQAVLPPPTPKRSPRHGATRQRGTPPSRSTPPRPAKRNRLSVAASPNSDWKSPGMRPPKWSASPIAIVGSRQVLCATPATLHFDMMTPSPLVRTPKNSSKPSSKQRLSFGLSPITFPSPTQAERIKSEEEKDEEEKPSFSAPSNDETPPLSSTDESVAGSSPDAEKENGDGQAQPEGGHQQIGSSSSHASRSVATLLPTKEAALMRGSIPQRQQAFMEAMEAEALSKESPSRAAAPPSSTLSLYREAKRLGVNDPQAQWQYVRTLRQGDQKHKNK
ncbi:unnamed protein product [Phytophthora lilii]|uniref:Unnamed protein product n=1 Tax=Phytophthora lilii TaxID=2077276 RepID=A0A9W6YEI9_9STRA|nr:unnamed protein product [Phytophthora lilii]